MVARHRILLLDDDQKLLETYEEILSGLPSSPEVHTANSGPRAMAMLETDQYRLLICDLKMPKMDGLQVLSIVRRKYPQLRTVALTSMHDEQYRSRAYALGVDMFWHKPSNEQEIKMFLECIESLMGRERDNGFRGVQSKSLVDIIQLECISQSSSVLRISNGRITGKIWIQEGEVIDAEAGESRGEVAFQKILGWKNGSFETLPAEPKRSRTINKSYNALLLETAQFMDESASGTVPANPEPAAPVSPLARLTQVDGIEFVLAMKPADQTQQARGLENPERMATWARSNLDRFRTLGDRLHAGPLSEVEGIGPQRHVSLASHGDTELCLGWKPSMSLGQVREMTKKVLTLWAS